ncbi:MAG: hypothetical protein Q9159_001607 [Coniocarpon cinnabarinum]
MVGFLSAAGLVGFLSEPDPQLQIFALRSANDNIDSMWTEFAAAVSQIEGLYEDESFPERELAALVAAKIYYHLQEYDESMIFALGAGKLFDIDRSGEFEETIIARCIDAYIADQTRTRTASESRDIPPDLDSSFSQSKGAASTSASMTSPVTPFSQSALPSRSLLSRQDSSALEEGVTDVGIASDGEQTAVRRLPPATKKSLQAIIRRLFERGFQEGAYRQVLGIAVEAKNLDVLRDTIERASSDGGAKGKSKPQISRGEELMDYLLDVCMNIVQERGLRTEILELILHLLASDKVASPDYFSIAKCIVYLGQHSQAADLLRRLVETGDARSRAIAYQISFDLFDNGTQEFLTKVINELPRTEEEKSEFSGMNGTATQPSHESAETANESTALLSEQDSSSGNAASTLPSRTKASQLPDEQRKAYNAISEILTGTKSLELNLEFLYRANKSDRQVLTKLKNSLESRNSIFHNAVCFANAFTNSGTTSDWFIRENLDWLHKAVNWSKFSVTASLGVIHRGIIGQGRKLLEPYLKDSQQGSGSAYSKGGALYGLGLIYTNHGKHVTEYLFDQLKKASSEEVIQHGAALGLGVAGMATEAPHIVEELKSALWQESAISGQAAGLSIGLVLIGSGNVDAVKDLMTYAHDTDHDKTVRGTALGLALIMYNRQEAADVLINGMLDDPNPTIRYGGVMALALAYCGTSSNKAVRRLLHLAVSDVNDDVRRMAVMSLGFVLFRKPSSVPRMVELLAESYNPHVRYGATMALGIACAGTGLEEAIDLLEPMMKDSTDFVRQGTLIALAMIMMQQSEAMNPKVVTIRKHLQKVVTDRHEDAMAKFGAALAIGIIDAGGRNCTIGLQTQTGNLNMSAIVGMAVFTQYWYWFPFTHFLTLALTPTSITGVDQDLDVPQLKLYCNARPSTFEYPPSMEVKKDEEPERVKAAVLSTTAQAQRRKEAKERQARGSDDAMEVDDDTAEKKADSATDQSKDENEKMDVDEPSEKKEEAAGKKTKREKEKVGFELDNMSRVLPSQLKYTSFVEGGRYVPVKKPSGVGVIVLHDTQPDESKVLIERQVKKPAPAQPRSTVAAPNADPSTPQQPQTQNTQADAAAVLNAVDEDEEGVEEAECPAEFTYESDGEDA